MLCILNSINESSNLPRAVTVVNHMKVDYVNPLNSLKKEIMIIDVLQACLSVPHE